MRISTKKEIERLDFRTKQKGKEKERIKNKENYMKHRESRLAKAKQKYAEKKKQKK